MNKEILTPIIEAKDKERKIETKVDYYMFYLTHLSPIIRKISKKGTEPLTRISNLLRKEINRNIRDYYTRLSVVFAIDVLEEHDRYIWKLLSEDVGKLVDFYERFFETNEPEIYFRTLHKTSLTLNAIMVAMVEKPKVTKELSLIARKYADHLEPFVATFQVLLEPELVHLRKKTEEQDLERMKELGASLLASKEMDN
ncbi:MAG: hypothetical protein ACE5KU_01145 [Nitrososphaerales archaeon]